MAPSLPQSNTTIFKLSASLPGHEDDIRAVAFPQPSAIYSASRDATVRRWKRRKLNDEAEHETWEADILTHGTEFVNSVALVPPTDEFPDGLVVSGGKEAVVDVRSPDQIGGDPKALLVGHQGNVCALATSPSGQYLVSGSWDNSARIWRVGTWQEEVVLEGHEASVWAVVFWDEDTVVTACADTFIRVFHRSGKMIREINAGKDVVRALCRYEAMGKRQFASAGNDAVIRIWTLDGAPVIQLHGHENFIYSLAKLPNGDLVSSSEDRTIRVWRDAACIQTITHPAISVWTVAANMESGDIVSGSSDKMIRVFTRDPERVASAEVLKAFDESVAQSAIPQQATQVNREGLPGPEFLTQKSGTKEGQVVMIKESNGSIAAYQWSTATRLWVNVGTVVEGVGSSGRKTAYMGEDYDYVFDVDIAEGQPPLKLPYNLSQNPYEAATKFIQDNELPIGYLDQTAQFIISNTHGATFGQSTDTRSAPDPFGEENRYRPGEVPSSSYQPKAAVAAKVLPQKEYLLISQANVPPIHKKLVSLNELLLKNGEKDKSLNPDQLATMETLVRVLPKTGKQSPALSNSPEIKAAVRVLLHALQLWPESSLLPVLDFLRLIALQSPALALWRGGSGERSLIDILRARDIMHLAGDQQPNPNLSMLLIRLLANLFATKDGVALAWIHASFCLESAKGAAVAHGGNRNLQIAETTLLINFAVAGVRRSDQTDVTMGDADSGEALPLDGLRLVTRTIEIVKTTDDSEVVYRGLVVVGSLVKTDEAVRKEVRANREQVGWMGKLQDRFGEPRIKGVCGEIRELLNETRININRK